MKNKFKTQRSFQATKKGSTPRTCTAKFKPEQLPSVF